MPKSERQVPIFSSAARRREHISRRRHTLLALALVVLLTAPDIAIVDRGYRDLPLVQRALVEPGLLTGTLERIDERGFARDLGVSPQELLAAERVLRAQERIRLARGASHPADPLLAIPVPGYLVLVGPSVPLRALLALLLAGAIYLWRSLRRRERRLSTALRLQARRRELLRRTRDDRIEELTRINEKLNLMQQKLVHAEKFASIGRLSATLAHEIRNPITVIQNSTGYILGEVPEGSSAAEAVGIINEESRRLNGIVTDLLNFARPKPPRLASVDVNSLMRSWLPTIADDLARKNIGMTSKLGLIPENAWIDADQFHQVLLNVIWNARDAILEKGGAGRIEVVTELVEPRCIAVRVRDNGCGMTPVVLAQIAEPFYTTKAKGTGLGVSVCVQLMEAMGGAFRVDSTPGTGTTISLTMRTASSTGADAMTGAVSASASAQSSLPGAGA